MLSSYEEIDNILDEKENHTETNIIQEITSQENQDDNTTRQFFELYVNMIVFCESMFILLFILFVSYILTNLITYYYP